MVDTIEGSGDGPNDPDAGEQPPTPVFHAWPEDAPSEAPLHTAVVREVGPVRRMAVILAVLLPVLVSILGLVWAVTGGRDQRVADAFPAGDAAIERLEEGAFALWSRNDDGLAVRWNACEPIRWVFNPVGAPLGAVDQLQVAMARITAETGLDFQYEGETTEAPRRDREPWQPDRYPPERWAPVLISWRTAETTDAPLTANDRAVAIPVAVGVPGARAFVTAQVIFNRDLAGTPGFADRRWSIGITMLHELLHVVGLQHVDDTGEIMFPFPVFGDNDFGPGDLVGMRELGKDHPCIETPKPSKITVDYG